MKKDEDKKYVTAIVLDGKEITLATPIFDTHKGKILKILEKAYKEDPGFALEYDRMARKYRSWPRMNIVEDGEWNTQKEA